MTPFFTHHMTLLFDALCYHAAHRCYDSALQCLPRINKAEQVFHVSLQKEKAIFEEHKHDLHSSYDEHERLAIVMEGQEYEINAAYGPFLQYLAMIHILATIQFGFKSTERVE